MRTDTTTHRLYVPIAQIIEGDRVRQDYGDLEELAESIKSEGLIHPIVIDLSNRLVAGGRRFRAIRDVLKQTEIAITYIETLDDAHLRRLEAEENVRRKAMTWQEVVRSIKTVHSYQAVKGALSGKRWTQEMTGQLLGMVQADVSNALALSSLIDKGDEEINKCENLTTALKVMLSRLENRVNAAVAKATLPGQPVGRTVDIMALPDEDIYSTVTDRTLPAGPTVGLAQRPDAPEMPAGVGETPQIVVPLSSMLLRGSCLDLMVPDMADHIICDPPYAIEMGNIQQSNIGMDVSSTVDEHQVMDNMKLLEAFIPKAYTTLRDKGYLVMWCDFDHFNWISMACIAAGFTIQRWPITWVKTHPCTNGAAAYNFTKNYEIALVARKGNATLVNPQTSSYWQGSGLGEKDLFGHPFAKPVNLWRWLYSAVAMRGQTVLDPFAGSGSAVVSALGIGLKPIGMELNEAHYNRLVVNVSNTYRSMHPNVAFQ